MTILDELALKFGSDKSSAGHDLMSQYHSEFVKWREEEFVFFELGVLNGSSLLVWENFFPRATIVGADLNPPDLEFGPTVHLRECNSGDPRQLEALVQEFGAPSIVLDDASHRSDHQQVAIRTLFPHLVPGGIHIVEDLHTSFEPGFVKEGVIPTAEILAQISYYLNMRGEPRVKWEQNPSNVAWRRVAEAVQKVEFLKRSAILHKNQQSLRISAGKKKLR